MVCAPNTLIGPLGRSANSQWQCVTRYITISNVKYFLQTITTRITTPSSRRRRIPYIAMATINRPVQLAEFEQALRELDDGQLKATKTEIERATAKLKRTNNKLLKLCGNEPVHDVSDNDSDSDSDEAGDEEARKQHEKDRHLYHEIISENDLVIRNQVERVNLVQQELDFRGLT